LSPVAYAAWTIGQYESAQQFAVDWYGSGGIPKAHLRNTEQAVMTQDTAVAAKSRFKASVEGRDVFVTGKDWEYKPIQAEMAGSEWLEAQRFGIGDVARFFGVPGNLIDAGASGEGVTYANVTQRNMQFLIMHLGPAVIRREKALSKLTPMPRFVKLNTDALLRMDPASRALMQASRIANRTLTVTEARALEDLPPLTEEQIAEFEKLFGKVDTSGTAGKPALGPAPPVTPPPPPPPPAAAKSNGNRTLMGDIKDRLLI
jgi:HK97 family phage portal protein